MLFLIRAAFWLMIIVLLLPTDEQQRSEVYGTAQAAVNDVATSATAIRRPVPGARMRSACSCRRREFGARMLMDLVKARRVGAAADTAEPTRPSPLPRDAAAPMRPRSPSHPLRHGASQDTLDPEDREEAWSGPTPAGT